MTTPAWHAALAAELTEAMRDLGAEIVDASSALTTVTVIGKPRDPRPHRAHEPGTTGGRARTDPDV